MGRYGGGCGYGGYSGGMRFNFALIVVLFLLLIVVLFLLLIIVGTSIMKHF